MPWYAWAKKFFDSTARYNLLCAANQISKSSTQIRKCIHWATATDLWGGLWRRRPLQFWYLYPTREVATIEFEKKWVEEFLPKGSYKDHPVYGWRPEYKNKFIWALHFNTGVSIYFKTYATDASHLQSGSCDAVFCDEELPSELYDELNFRLAATDGYFHMVFTATLGQEFWREAIEEIGSKNERLKDAFKQQISMYDCLTYADGSPSHWTTEKIERIKNSCQSQNEILKRVYGRFIVDSGLKYPSFERTINIKPAHSLPKDWLIYVGIDIGGGGEGHPSAITFVAVSPDFKKGRVFMGWRGDGVLTTASDVLMKYLEMRGNLPVAAAYFDWAAKDFGTIASRLGISIIPAEKSHERGEQILNVLFKNQILAIYDTEDLRALAQEFATLQISTPKNKAKDDFIDSCRYAVVSIPWDWSVISGEKIEAPQRALDERAERRAQFFGEDPQAVLVNEDEFQAWNELYEV